MDRDRDRQEQVAVKKRDRLYHVDSCQPEVVLSDRILSDCLPQYFFNQGVKAVQITGSVF
jgi:hypothetical protein